MSATAVDTFYVRTHRLSRIPKRGDSGFILRVCGTTEYLFSYLPARRGGLPVLHGDVDPMLGLRLHSEGAVQVLRVDDRGLQVRAISEAEIARKLKGVA